MKRLSGRNGFAFEKLFFELLQVCDWNKLLEALLELMKKQLNVKRCWRSWSCLSVTIS